MSSQEMPIHPFSESDHQFAGFEPNEEARLVRAAFRHRDIAEHCSKSARDYQLGPIVPPIVTPFVSLLIAIQNQRALHHKRIADNCSALLEQSYVARETQALFDGIINFLNSDSQ